MARTTARRRLQAPPVSGHFRKFFHPRTYQVPVIQAMTSGAYQRAVTVWHRGAGKDFTWLLLTFASMSKRPGQYFHVFPTYAQGKKAIWNGYVRLHGEDVKFLSLFPEELIENKLDTELQIKFKPFEANGHKVGSIYQIVGAEDADALRGTAPAGVVFSEYPWMLERIWQEIVDPRLTQTGGWAGFAFTPCGKDHAYKLWRAAQGNPAWFTHFATVANTRRDAQGEDGSFVITPEQIAQKRVEGIAEEILQQEYYCSFEGYLHGTIYGDLLQRARQERRIGQVPYDPRRPVGACLDIGRTDLTAIWFWQVEGSAIRWIDYHAARGMDSASCIRFLKEHRPYHYARIRLPHDAKELRFHAQNSVVQEFRTWFPRADVDLAERTGHEIGHNAVRRMFSRFYFDEAKCGTELAPDIPSGLDSLAQYRRKWDDSKKDFSIEPVHDKYSHGASALKTGMLAWEEGLEDPGRRRERPGWSAQTPQAWMGA